MHLQRQRRLRFLVYSCAFFLVALVSAGCFGVGESITGKPTATPGGPVLQISPTGPASYNPQGMLHAQGNRLVDGNGNTVVLRGAQIEGPLNNWKPWQSGKRPGAMFSATIFQVMARDWHMNVLRLPTSNWIYAADPTEYLNQLDLMVQEANSAGLYVILDLHDTVKGGSTYGQEATLPKTEDIAYWKAIAAHYKTNPRVLFDVYNEPVYPNWDAWAHGGINVGGANVVSMQALVDAIRSVGAQQAIVVEPGSAGKDSGGNSAENGGWSGFDLSDAIKDPNIIYSTHVYHAVASPPSVQDAKWGPLLNHYPIFYGEWAFLPNAQGSGSTAKCDAVSRAQAPSAVLNFLNYMASRNAGWVAWAFEPHYLVTDYSSYTPTTLNTAWTCGNDTTVDVGMGQIVKQYLDQH